MAYFFQKMIPFIQNKIFCWIGLFLIAFVYCVYVFGFSIFNPTEINWLFKYSDIVQHFLAWGFFQKESWHFPPGLIETFSLSQPLSIGLTDSFPLLAFLFKPFSSFLPSHFHYFGWAIFLNISLQLYFGFLWGKYLTKNIILQILVAIFLMLSPPFLYRLNYHIALASHWLILAGLLVYQKPWNFKYWIILTALSSLIHPYLMTMLFALMFFNMLGHAHSHFKTRFLHFLICIITALFLCYLCGQFVNGSTSMRATGFGYYAMNILSFFDSSVIPNSLTPSIFFGKNHFEDGNQYLGFGMIILGCLTLYIYFKSYFFKHQLKPIFNQNNKLFLLCAALLAFFALSPAVRLGNTTLIDISSLYNFPFFFDFKQMFRANGRFGWILFYILNIFILGSIIRYFSNKMSIILLSLALVLQLIDLNSYYKNIHHQHQTAALNVGSYTSFPIEEWQPYAKKDAQMILLTESTAQHLDFNDIYVADWSFYFTHVLTPAYFAYLNNMHLNFSFSRSDLNKTNQFLFHHLDLIKKGTPAPNTLYVFLADYSPEYLKAILPIQIYQQLLFKNTYALLPIQEKNDKFHAQR